MSRRSRTSGAGSCHLQNHSALGRLGVQLHHDNRSTSPLLIPSLHLDVRRWRLLLKAERWRRRDALAGKPCRRVARRHARRPTELGRRELHRRRRRRYLPCVLI
jgi:hypothetical protein